MILKCDFIPRTLPFSDLNASQIGYPIKKSIGIIIICQLIILSCQLLIASKFSFK
jgi:hypothetical protein